MSGIQNETADRLSRNLQDKTERQLNPRVFKTLSEQWGRPEIDLFASRHNYQLNPFVSWHADPDAFATDAVSLSWKHKHLVSVQGSSEVAGGSRPSLSHSAIVENTSLVSEDVSDVNQPASTSTQGRIPSAVSTRYDQAPPAMAQISNDGMSLVRKRLRQ